MTDLQSSEYVAGQREAQAAVLATRGEVSDITPIVGWAVRGLLGVTRLLTELHASRQHITPHFRGQVVAAANELLERYRPASDE